MNDSKDSGVAAESHPSQKETETTILFSVKLTEKEVQMLRDKRWFDAHLVIAEIIQAYDDMKSIKNNNGNLTKENAKGFDGLDWEYPVYIFKKGNTTSLTIGPITLCPEGYTSEIYYKSLEDNFSKYVKEIIKEYESFNDKKLMTLSYIGFKRSARLEDEKRRRKLIE